MEIQSNKAQWASGVLNIQWIETGKSDCTISAIVNIPSGASNSGIAFRVEGASDWLIATLNAASDVVYVLKRSPGLTIVAQQAMVLAADTNYVLEVVLSGSSIKVYVDGALKIDTTEAHNQTITKHGIHTDGSIAVKIDEFQGY